MPNCPYCDCDLPGVEEVCAPCFEEHVIRSSPKRSFGEQPEYAGQRDEEGYQPNEFASMTWRQQLMLLLIEAVLGVVLFGMISFVPDTFLPYLFGPFLAVAAGYLIYDKFDNSKRAADGAPVTWIVMMFTMVARYLSRDFGDAWFRLALVGLCMTTSLIYLERRRLV